MESFEGDCVEGDCFEGDYKEAWQKRYKENQDKKMFYVNDRYKFNRITKDLKETLQKNGDSV